MADAHDDGFIEEFYIAPDGLRLYARIYGAANSGLPILCLAGLTRNSRDFHHFALHLSRDSTPPRRVICLDYRGRGRSAHAPDPAHYNIGIEAGDVVAACSHFRIEHAQFVGTSRGGLSLHVLAQMKPDLMAAVVLNDVGPVLGVKGLRHIKDYLARGRQPRDWAEAVEMLKQTHGPAFPALREQDWKDLADAIYAEKDGTVVADYDPALTAPMASMDLNQPIPDLWPQFEAFAQVPVMVVRGENSELLTMDTVAEMANRHPGLQVLTATGQGHAPILHLGRIAEEIASFLSRH